MEEQLEVQCLLWTKLLPSVYLSRSGRTHWCKGCRSKAFTIPKEQCWMSRSHFLNWNAGFNAMLTARNSILLNGRSKLPGPEVTISEPNSDEQSVLVRHLFTLLPSLFTPRSPLMTSHLIESDTLVNFWQPWKTYSYLISDLQPIILYESYSKSISPFLGTLPLFTIFSVCI